MNRFYAWADVSIEQLHLLPGSAHVHIILMVKLLHLPSCFIDYVLHFMRERDSRDEEKTEMRARKEIS